MDSVIVLEQTAPGKFERHSLETVSANHLTCVAGDLRGNGKIDLIVGNFFLVREPNQTTDSLTIWWNERLNKGKAAAAASPLK